MLNALKCAQRTVGAPESGAQSWGRAVSNELARRDPHWIRTGVAVKPSYETPELEAWLKEKRNEHQVRTAERLGERGYHFHFQIDERHFFDHKKGQQQTIGLADGIVSGEQWELKTLQSGNGKGSVNSAFKSVKKKEGVDVFVLDNTESRLSDQDVRRWAEEYMYSRGISRVLFLGNGIMRYL
ncbi:MAG: hypothetical protein FWF11_00285 [Coriobacteriia bacterium]|nr:hypothetical protein [Coriobacteriia bacterium]